MAKLSKDVFRRIRKSIRGERPPFSPPIYPPRSAWGPVKSADILEAWKRTVELGGPVDMYVHMPYCRTRCTFCGLYARVLKDARKADPLIEAVRREAEILAPVFLSKKLISLRVGGGTPSMLSVGQIDRLFGLLYDSFRFERSKTGSLLGSIFEANPGTMTLAKSKRLVAAGVNGLALGVQSLDAGVLSAINREMTPLQARRAFRDARTAGIPYIAVELMYGLDGQKEASFLSDVVEVIRWRADRVILYAFMPNMRTVGGAHEEPEATRRSRAIEAGVREGLALLGDAGYHVSRGIQYENSGVLKESPGYAVYNRNFNSYGERDAVTGWHSVLGLGPGALSVAHRSMRYQNIARPEAYGARLEKGELGAEAGTAVSPRTDRVHYLLLKLEQDGAVSRRDYASEYGERMESRFGAKLKALLARGSLRQGGARYALGSPRDAALEDCQRELYEDWVNRSLRKAGLKDR